jgi:hypothetical protein
MSTGPPVDLGPGSRGRHGRAKRGRWARGRRGAVPGSPAEAERPLSRMFTFEIPRIVVSGGPLTRRAGRGDLSPLRGAR